MAALFQSLGRERNQAPVSKVKNTPAGLRGYLFIMLYFQISALSGIILYLNGRFIGHSNTARAGNAAAGAAHNFKHIAVAAFGGIALEQFDVFGA